MACLMLTPYHVWSWPFSQLLQYNTIISASQYAKYYFSLRHSVRVPSRVSAAEVPGEGMPAGDDVQIADASGRMPGSSNTAERAGDNFRSKYFMAINVPSSARLQEQSAALANHRASAAKDVKMMSPVGIGMIEHWQQADDTSESRTYQPQLDDQTGAAMTAPMFLSTSV